jgi:LysM domain-containing protein
MTASAQLRNLPAARSEKILPRDARPVRLAALTRPLPAPPEPVPPLAPPVRGRPVVCLAYRRAPAPAEAAFWRFGRVAGLVVAATVTLIVVGCLDWAGQAASPVLPAQTAVVRVGAGETEWDVARRVAPRFDQHAVVERIRQWNGIVGSAVQPGQQLLVPDGR